MAIRANRQRFKLAALCDPNGKVLGAAGRGNHITLLFQDFSQMLKQLKGKVDLIVIASPNFLHHNQAIKALDYGYNVLIEKPVSFKSLQSLKIGEKARILNRRAFATLQVRYYPAVKLFKNIIARGILGNTRFVSLVQSWQRPEDFFSSWRRDQKKIGGILYEVALHYLDIMQWAFGVPRVLSTHTFKLKYKHISFEDTLLSTLCFKNGAAGSLEITVAAEPSNLECSLMVIGEKGSIKLGGKRMDKIEYAKFANQDYENLDIKTKIAKEKAQMVTKYGKLPISRIALARLYEDLALDQGISVEEATGTIKFIENIYSKVDVDKC
ncbi:hypothetical protein A2210_00515 [Candidatus Woesebacteria bacterium RIFOXYA1_FULL_40_18]|uniref:Oxidoreductase domain protein n=2 Tax=Candidatus Woeseibacteriota TaxID=1752722 RepID=A0A0G0SFX4_9BACT|nr:MAG: hypothetical protein UU03_C0001G0024 [Candidatus Woesebacteria bacterium GW2011_GWA1_40_45]OGM76448.1 MAG: hypothetical protein A2210_00515 [Candidatus Woesebacteria bacterium RIFOXYA1_FULL_40_18]